MHAYVTLSRNPRLIEMGKEQALMRRRASYAASHQSLDFLSNLSICRTPLSRFLRNSKNKLRMYR